MRTNCIAWCVTIGQNFHLCGPDDGQMEELTMLIGGSEARRDVAQGCARFGNEILERKGVIYLVTCGS